MSENTNDNGLKIAQSILATFSDMGTNAKANVQGFIDGIFTRKEHRIADANTALAGGTTPSINVASTHTIYPSTPIHFRCKHFKLVAKANIAQTNTNFATINLVYNDGTGNADTVIASANTENKTGALGAVTSAVPLSFTLTAANARIPAGSCVQIKVTKSGAGGLEMPELDFEVGLTPSS